MSKQYNREIKSSSTNGVVLTEPIHVKECKKHPKNQNKTRNPHANVPEQNSSSSGSKISS